MRSSNPAPARAGARPLRRRPAEAWSLNTAPTVKSLLICHEDEPLDHDGLARWLASFSRLVGVVVLRETRGRKLRRIRREWRRVGPVRFLDVVAFRAYYRATLARRDARWRERQLAVLRGRYAEPPEDVPRFHTHSPNTAEAEIFIRAQAPDIILARCKVLLKESVFSIPQLGTFVLHPGICPEYRNAHGCFWALSRGDTGRVGVTLLRIDRGVDTGPVFGYFSCDHDARTESHVVIQHRSLFENLDSVRARLEEIAGGTAMPVDTTGRESRAWGQPWLTGYLRLRARARRRSRT